MDAVEQTIRNIAAQLQRTELGLADLQSSVNDQTTTLQRLRTSLQDDISTEGRKLLEAQAHMLLATLTAIRGSRHSALDSLNSLDQRLDEVDQRMGNSSTDLKDMLDHQKLRVQACQMLLENIEKAIRDICQVSNQQAARDWRNDWLEVLMTTGAVISAFAGVSNMLTIRTLNTRLEAPVGKKSPSQSITLSPQMQRYLAQSKREEYPTFILSGKDDRERILDLNELDRFMMAWDNATKVRHCHVCFTGPHRSKTTPRCINHQCGHDMCDECKKEVL